MRFNGRDPTSTAQLASLVAADGASGGFVKDSEVGAWTPFVPSVAASAGTITTVGTVVARYLQVGKLVWVSYNIPITTAGSGANDLVVGLPVAALSVANINGAEVATTGVAVAGRAYSANATTINVRTYNNAYPVGSNGSVVIMSGCYEAA